MKKTQLQNHNRSVKSPGLYLEVLVTWFTIYWLGLVVMIVFAFSDSKMSLTTSSRSWQSKKNNTGNDRRWMFEIIPYENLQQRFHFCRCSGLVVGVLVVLRFKSHPRAAIVFCSWARDVNHRCINLH